MKVRTLITPMWHIFQRVPVSKEIIRLRSWLMYLFMLQVGFCLRSCDTVRSNNVKYRRVAMELDSGL